MNDKTTQNTDQLDVARTFLNQRIQKEKRSLIIRGAVGTLITIIVIVYMGWISSVLNELGTPEQIGQTVVTSIKAEAPALVTEIRRELLANKDQFLTMLTDRINELVDTLVLEGEKAFRDLISQIASESIEELNRHYVKVLNDDHSKLRELLKNPDDVNLEEKLVAAFEADIKASFNQTEFDRDFREPLSKKHRESIQHLNDINRKLQRLADTESPTRRDALTIRFLKLWVSYVGDMGDPSAEEPLLELPQTKPIPPEKMSPPPKS